MSKKYFTITLLLVISLHSSSQCKIIKSLWGELNPRDTRPAEEKKILFSTNMNDSVLQKALESRHSFSQRAGVITALEKIGQGAKLTSGVKEALKNLSRQTTIYEVSSPLKVALILSDENDKKVRTSKLAECFNEEGNHLLKHTSIFYAGKMGFDSLLSELSTKLRDRDLGMADLDQPPYEGVFHYAQAVIDRINALHLPKEKQVEYLQEKFMSEEPTVAKEEVLIDIGQDIIPIFVSTLTTLFENNFKDTHTSCIANHILGKLEISDSKATQILIPFLNNENNYIRELTVRALSGVGTEEAIPYLQKVKVEDKYLQKDLPGIIEGIRTRQELERKINKSQ